MQLYGALSVFAVVPCLVGSVESWCFAEAATRPARQRAGRVSALHHGRAPYSSRTTVLRCRDWRRPANCAHVDPLSKRQHTEQVLTLAREEHSRRPRVGTECPHEITPPLRITTNNNRLTRRTFLPMVRAAGRICASWTGMVLPELSAPVPPLPQAAATKGAAVIERAASPSRCCPSSPWGPGFP